MTQMSLQWVTMAGCVQCLKGEQNVCMCKCLSLCSVGQANQKKRQFRKLILEKVATLS